MSRIASTEVGLPRSRPPTSPTGTWFDSRVGSLGSLAVAPASASPAGRVRSAAVDPRKRLPSSTKNQRLACLPRGAGRERRHRPQALIGLRPGGPVTIPPAAHSACPGCPNCRTADRSPLRRHEPEKHGENGKLRVRRGHRSPTGAAFASADCLSEGGLMPRDVPDEQGKIYNLASSRAPARSAAEEPLRCARSVVSRGSQEASR